MFTRQLRIKNLFALLGMSFVASVGLVGCETWLPEPPSTCTPNEQQCTGTALKVCGEDERWAEETRYCSEVAQVVAGGWHTCVRFEDGSVKCWGRNNFGQLGLGDDMPRGIEAPQLGANLHAINLGSGRTAKAIFAGGQHTCALLDDGSVKCWGNNEFDQLGQGHTQNIGDKVDQIGESLPVVDLGPGQTAEALALGWRHTCALLKGGRVKCWGLNWAGQLGQGKTSNVGGDKLGTLPPIELGSGIVKSITSGDFHVCALFDDGRVKCWGRNEDGQLGRGNTTNAGDSDLTGHRMGDDLDPIDLGPGMTATAIAAGGNHTCALLNNGDVKCWGRNWHGQLGQEDTERRGDNAGEMGYNLRRIELGPDMTAKKITAGVHHTCVILNDNTIKCWGRNDFGQLGLGSATDWGWLPLQMGKNLPRVLLGAEETAVEVAAGHYFTCALLNGSNAKCWGANESGQLGQGHIADRGKNVDEMGDKLPPIKFW